MRRKRRLKTVIPEGAAGTKPDSDLLAFAAQWAAKVVLSQKHRGIPTNDTWDDMRAEIVIGVLNRLRKFTFGGTKTLQEYAYCSASFSLADLQNQINLKRNLEDALSIQVFPEREAGSIPSPQEVKQAATWSAKMITKHYSKAVVDVDEMIEEISYRLSKYVYGASVSFQEYAYGQARIVFKLLRSDDGIERLHKMWNRREAAKRRPARVKKGPRKSIFQPHADFIAENAKNGVSLRAVCLQLESSIGRPIKLNSLWSFSKKRGIRFKRPSSKCLVK